MIQTWCWCGQRLAAAETAVHQPAQCPQCGAALRFVCAEDLPPGAGAADFDVCLTIEAAPPGSAAAGQQIFLGGVPEIEIGKLPDKRISLPGTMVSRFHAKLSRLDFGPSRWKIVDHQSTNGVFVNGLRVVEHELRHGDVIRIGEYHLRVRAVAPPAPSVPEQLAQAAAARAESGGPVCPSCQKTLAPKAKICVACGIHVPSGRPLLIAHGVDENDLYVHAENTISVVSWIVPFGLYPIASEAFGTRKPIVIWSIAAFTVLTSILFLFALKAQEIEDQDAVPPAASLMLWSGSNSEQVLTEHLAKLKGKRAISAQELRKLLAAAGPHAEFHPYQLLTHAFLHGGLMHLAGNLLFLIVLGTRVNSLIGNVLTAILYPILAIAAGAAHMLATAHEAAHPMLGASGAIMGLAGMYLVLFPVHKVYMSIWLRNLLTGFRVGWKVWPVRGFWVVLFYIAFDVLFTLLGVHDSVAHWAHLGGFIAGVTIAILLLLTRLVNARGGDVLSVMLGRYAWPLVGRPSRRAVSAATVGGVGDPAPASATPATGAAAARRY